MQFFWHNQGLYLHKEEGSKWGSLWCVSHVVGTQEIKFLGHWDNWLVLFNFYFVQIFFQFFEEQREMQCDQFKELLKDKEEEIQTLIQELDTGRTQSLDQDEIGMMNNQVFFVVLFITCFRLDTLVPIPV